MKRGLVLILLFILITPTVIAPLRNHWDLPNFVRYPELQIRTKDMPIHDFSEPNRVTYYYNIVGSEIPITINNKTLYVSVKRVDYNEKGEEYATVEISDGGDRNAVYFNLYERKIVDVDILGTDLRFIAHKIIDHDNIEYLTVEHVDSFFNLGSKKINLLKFRLMGFSVFWDFFD
ncbi:MAG: hypothetical protein PHG05_01925 [Candidatus Nanoarchaeia archaeon]|nr:hypothetical protein [Candidatus Nanoarchaeia archaeon]